MTSYHMTAPKDVGGGCAGREAPTTELVCSLPMWARFLFEYNGSCSAAHSGAPFRVAPYRQ